MLLFPLAVGAEQPASSVMQSASFNDAFSSYYEALSGYTHDDLMLELSETIEDVLTTGSHMSQVSLDYKVRQVEGALLSQLRKELCAAAASLASNEVGSLKVAAVKSTTVAGEQASVSFDPEAVGMISGVAVRLAQGTPRSRFCDG